MIMEVSCLESLDFQCLEHRPGTKTCFPRKHNGDIRYAAFVSMSLDTYLAIDLPGHGKLSFPRESY